jgi:N-acetylglucosamine kinase-like BadF-type ATPase
LIHYLDHPKTSSPALKETVIDVFGSERESDIVAAVHRSLTPATILARFARALGSDAKSGEEYAIRSLDRHTAALADVVALHVRRNLSPTPVLHLSLAGGLWKGASVFRDVFVEQLKSRFGDTALVVNKIVRPPMYGAVELAREMSFGN